MASSQVLQRRRRAPRGCAPLAPTAVLASLALHADGAVCADYLPIFGWRRRPYLVLCQLAAAVTYFFVSAAHTKGHMVCTCTVLRCAEVRGGAVAMGPVVLGWPLAGAPAFQRLGICTYPFACAHACLCDVVRVCVCVCARARLCARLLACRWRSAWRRQSSWPSARW